MAAGGGSMAKRTAAPAPARKRTAAPRKTKTNEALPAPATHPGPSEDSIRLRAYQLYLERGGASGRDFDDWLKAERDLKGDAS